MTLLQAVALIDRAKSPKDLFPGTDEEQVALYRELAKATHPDRHREATSKAKAEKAFKKLSSFYASRNGHPHTHQSIIGNWEILGPLGKGDIADVYKAQAIDEGAVFKLKAGITALKLVRDSSNNDLMGFEKEALVALQKGKSQYTKYLPKMVEHLAVGDRDVNVTTLAGDCVSLTDIRDLIGDGALDFRHAVWMMDRALSILGYVHNFGYVHGAVTPDHLLYRPKDHGLILIDWCASVKSGSGRHVPLIVDRWKALYPPEVIRKKEATPATDLYMVAESINWAIHGNRPKAFKPLFDHCWAGSPASRPRDTWALQDRWNEYAEKEYGPRKFVPLELPIH